MHAQQQVVRQRKVKTLTERMRAHSSPVMWAGHSTYILCVTDGSERVDGSPGLRYIPIKDLIFNSNIRGAALFDVSEGSDHWREWKTSLLNEHLSNPVAITSTIAPRATDFWTYEIEGFELATKAEQTIHKSTRLMFAGLSSPMSIHQFINDPELSAKAKRGDYMYQVSAARTQFWDGNRPAIVYSNVTLRRVVSAQQVQVVIDLDNKSVLGNGDRCVALTGGLLAALINNFR